MDLDDVLGKVIIVELYIEYFITKRYNTQYEKCPYEFL
jgi:hypothetical protein